MQLPATGVELAGTLERLVRLIRQLSNAGALSFSAASTLGRLLREGPQRLTELANAEAASQPAMTQLVGRLEREGLVRRTASPQDRRGVLVELTEAGRDLVELRRAERAEALQKIYDQLDAADQAAVAAAMPALTRLIDTGITRHAGSTASENSIRSSSQ
jgi:DNA-binding MarR family transcriptional regulator